MSPDRILNCFPLAWRARYEAEVRELLVLTPLSWRVAIDLIRACGDAWLREAFGWLQAAWALGRAAGLRLLVLMAVGWVGASTADSVALTPRIAVWVASNRPVLEWVAAFQWPVALLSYLFVVRPYADTGALVYRPTVLQWVGWSTFTLVLLAIDSRSTHLGDIIMAGLLLTMRHARWFVLFDSPAPTHPAGSVLRLR